MGQMRLLLAVIALATAATAAAQVPPDMPDIKRIRPSVSAPVSMFSGCGPKGLTAEMNACQIDANIKLGDAHEFTFTIPEQTGDNPFSLLLTAKSYGGLVNM